MSVASRPSHAPDTNRFGAPLPLRSPEDHVRSGVIAGKYRLERLLGEGGGGSVWHATNLQLEVPVAIKLLRPGPAQRELGERLRIEARAVARLVHPSIVRVFDIGEAAPGEPFIVMELLAGESLADRIYRERLSAIDAVRLLLPIADALAVAHAAGVIHRDLKPDNIVLCPEGDCVRPKLLDFGIAKITGGAKRTNITQRGTLVGSPSYMSPEQARGSDNLDFRTDIWSFCVVLYEALAGAMPFDAPDGAAVLRAVIQDPPTPLARVRGVDRQLWSLIEQGLSKPASLRPSSMTELGRELARWLRRHGVETDSAGATLETKWLPRTGLARVPHARTLELATADTARAPLPSFGGSVPGDPAPCSPPHRGSTFEPVTRGPPARPSRKAKKVNPGADHLLVLSATVATLLGLFVAVVWGTGAFDDEPRALAAAGFDPNAAFARVTAGMATSDSPGSSPAPAAEPLPEATREASSAPPPSPPDPPPPPDPPAAAQPPVAVDTAAPIATPAPDLAPAEKKAAVSVPAPRRPAAKSPLSLTTTLNSLAPAPQPPVKRASGGDGRAAKLRTPGTDLMVPY